MINEIEKAVRLQDDARLQEVVGNVASFCFKHAEDVGEPFSEAFFESLMEILQSEAFLKMPGAGSLLVLFEYDWARLTDTQRQRLLLILESLFPRVHDCTARFVAAELLGGFYANRAAFEVVQRLDADSDETRVLLPLAFENFVSESPDALLKQDALKSLERMRRDTSESVREEAELSLSRLKSKGILP